MLPTIFVSIASYRDPDCQNTVADLFAQAAHPERIFVGICWQFVPGEDDDCFKLEPLFPEQVRRLDIHASESLGACWARQQVQSLWQGEDYYFQIDSHMRFVSGWDERLLEMLSQCPGEKVVLSTYPLAFTPPRELANAELVTIHPKGFDEHGILAQRSTLTPLDQAPQNPTPTAFIGAGMLFAPGRIVTEVPYDPHVYFEGEEISLAARLWTSGWDIYTPNGAIAYHDYGTRPNRPRHWKDKQNWAELNESSRRRVRHLLDARRATDEAALAEIEQYGLGSVRTLQAYEAYSKLDFKGRLYQGKPLPLQENAADQPKQVTKRQSVFLGIWKDNFWGCNETRSGNGSSLAETARLRADLPPLLDFLGVHSLADAGCGDLNWMKTLTDHLQFYFGYDIVPDLISDVQAQFGSRRNCFFKALDVVTESLPQCDAIISRDCLTHLPLDAALLALRNFKRSGSRYLIATTHGVGRNLWVNVGGWHTLDMTAAPFNLPSPKFSISEGGSKTLGVWAVTDIPE
jgi:hypothetical protein